jgi:hypothetical protein
LPNATIRRIAVLHEPLPVHHTHHVLSNLIAVLTS